MSDIDIWDLGEKIYIKPNISFLKKINFLIRTGFNSKEKLYKKIKEDVKVPLSTFKNFMKYSYYNRNYYGSLKVFIICCSKLGISKFELQENIMSYKTQRGYNIIENPILPIKITPIFDMILAHNIADGTVIFFEGRQPYFGYRQYDELFRELYIRKIESVFGKIKFKSGDYFKKTTRSYCPAVVSQLFFKLYDLNERSFLSKEARLPKEILDKEKSYLLAVLLAFIIDEGNVDSTLISIKLKNPSLTEDLYKVCLKLNYDCSLKIKNDYGILYIKKMAMKKLFDDYKELFKRYPECNLGKISNKIELSLNITSRSIRYVKGNKDLIFRMLRLEDLTVNQIATKINMTRQGVRFHIKSLEVDKKIFRKGHMGERNIIYGV